MVNDSTSWVTVKQWYKTLRTRDPKTNLFKTYDIPVDWDIGRVQSEEGTIFVVGAPYQLFSLDIYGNSVADSRVLITREKFEPSLLETVNARTADRGEIHFKWPGI